MSTNDKKPIILFGLPRSGTTWVSQILTANDDWVYIHEPDNEKISPIAWIGKNNLHRFPYLTPQDIEEQFFHMWRLIFSGTWMRSKMYGQFRKKLSRNSVSLEAFIGEKTGLVYIDEKYRTVKLKAAPFSPDIYNPLALLVKLYLLTIQTSEK